MILSLCKNQRNDSFDAIRFVHLAAVFSFERYSAINEGLKEFHSFLLFREVSKFRLLLRHPMLVEL
jgi:hypothetical protein